VAKLFQICIVKRPGQFSFSLPSVIGLTGGIGAGKSTVARVFESFGAPVFDADNAAKQCYIDDLSLREAVISRFGSAIYSGGHFDKTALAERVFGPAADEDPSALSDLNALVHPAVARAFVSWHAQQVTPYVLREAAILFESGSNLSCDAVIVVTAPKAIRLERAARRDGISLDAVRARMEKQWPSTRLMERADHLIDSGGRLPLVPQVAAIHALLVGPVDIIT
jgi:dephospho-CoA kinase